MLFLQGYIVFITKNIKTFKKVLKSGSRKVNILPANEFKEGFLKNPRFKLCVLSSTCAHVFSAPTKLAGNPEPQTNTQTNIHTIQLSRTDYKGASHNNLRNFWTQTQTVLIINVNLWSDFSRFELKSEFQLSAVVNSSSKSAKQLSYFDKELRVSFRFTSHAHWHWQNISNSIHAPLEEKEGWESLSRFRFESKLNSKGCQIQNRKY